MISKAFRTMLKSNGVSKANYAKDVEELLKNKNVSGKNGKHYNYRYVAHVFNGHLQNGEVEKVIIEFFEEKIKIKKEADKRQNEIIKQYS